MFGKLIAEERRRKIFKSFFGALFHFFPPPLQETGHRFALKRMFVNNDKDLAVCKREINIVVSRFPT